MEQLEPGSRRLTGARVAAGRDVRSSRAAGSVAVIAVIVAVAWALACGASSPGGMSGPTMNNRLEAPDDAGPLSRDIMAREPVSNRVSVRHILIGWRDLADAYHGAMDPRAKARSRADAEQLVESLVARLRAGEPFEALMVEHSEDTGSAHSKQAIDVTPDAELVLDFKRLSLRLQVGEFGVVLTDYGWHIIKRVS